MAEEKNIAEADLNDEDIDDLNEAVFHIFFITIIF